jgi:hypothetical protein
MRRNILNLSRVLWLLGLAYLCSHFTSAAEEVKKDEMLNILKSVDEVMSSSFTMVLEYKVPANYFFYDSSQGFVSKTCTLVSTGQEIGIKALSNYEVPPSYGQLGTFGYRSYDFDKNRNLIVWRSLSKYGLSALDINDTIEELQELRVSPKGQILDDIRNFHIQKHAPGSKDNIYEIKDIFMALGRGFSEELETIIEVFGKRD